MRALLATALVLAALSPAARAASPSTLTYRGDSTRENRITGAPAPPLGVRWAADLGGPMSYPVYAGGRVFVSVRNTNGYGTTLYGLDASNGHVLWTRGNPGTYWYGGLTYDSGRLYVLNYDGNLMALAPATGAVLWSRSMGSSTRSTGRPPPAMARSM
jgi:outer membrane protein assembly factor BamB